jgi:DNA-binding transcriptional LysR family regulator
MQLTSAQPATGRSSHIHPRFPIQTRLSEMDSLGALNAFVRAAEARSFTDAGRQLGLSSSAIGKTVGRLEERLGVRLFHRTTRAIALTQEGQLFLDSCRRIFSEIDSVEAEFALTKGAPVGKLRVSLPLVATLMMPTLSGFMRAYPEIELSMEFTDTPVDIVDAGYDVVLIIGEAKDSQLMARSLGRFSYRIVGAPAYFARAGLPLTPDDLITHACLHRKCLMTGKLERWRFATRPTAGVPALPMAAAASTVMPLISLVELGFGIACVPDFAVQRQLLDGSLVEVLEDYMDHTDTIRAVWPSSRFIRPKLRVFVDFLAENLFPRVRLASKTQMDLAEISGPQVDQAPVLNAWRSQEAHAGEAAVSKTVPWLGAGRSQAAAGLT